MGRPRDRASSQGLLPLMEARPRKDGSFTYRYHPRGGKPISLGNDKVEAMRKVLDMNGVASGRNTVGAIWRAYKLSPQWKALAVRTKADYEKYAVELMKRFENAMPAEIKPTVVARYLRRERAEAPIRANREIALLSILMRQAVECGDIEANPCSAIRRNPEKPREEAPETADLAVFLAWVARQSDQRAKVGLMAEYASLAGNRKMEFLELTWPQVDRAAGIIRLVRGKQKGGKVKVETVSITPALENLLDRLAALPRATDCLYVFTTRDGNAYNSSGFDTMWQRLMTKALEDDVISKRFTFHDLRAYYTTQHKAQYGNLPELHANPATTAAIYDRSRVVVRKGLG